jgi:hypothetical protein
MRIRIYRAFASNNSGSYTLIGSFSSAGDAAEVAALLQQACDEHDAWLEATPYPYDGAAPLDAFMQAQGLTAAPKAPGRSDDWPEHGPKPSVVAAGHQVLFHVPYTVTMPALFGELMYRRGGRVDVELNHTHHDLAVEIDYWPEDMGWNDPGRAAALDAFEGRLRELLPELTGRGQHDNRPAVAPAFHRATFGGRGVAVIFADLVEGVQKVRALADETRTGLRLRVWECEPGPDPFAALRASARPWGQFRVILWQLGPDRIAAMKAVRDALACGLEEAKQALSELPAEVLVDVDETFAQKAAAKLLNAGCDAEVVVPARR